MTFGWAKAWFRRRWRKNSGVLRKRPGQKIFTALVSLAGIIGFIIPANRPVATKTAPVKEPCALGRRHSLSCGSIYNFVLRTGG